MQASASIQTPGGAAASFFSWTVIVLILLAVAAVMVIAGMIYGNRLARDRHRALDAAEERAEEAGVEPVPESSPIDLAAVPDAAKEPDPSAPADEPPAERAPKLAAKPRPPARPQVSVDPEPVAAAPVADTPAAPAPAPAPAVEPAIAGALALTTIKGLGPKVAALLAERGVTRVDQIAALDDAGAAALDAQLGSFAGRMARDRWIDQARLLASGDTAAYEAEFGKLG